MNKCFDTGQTCRQQIWASKKIEENSTLHGQQPVAFASPMSSHHRSHEAKLALGSGHGKKVLRTNKIFEGDSLFLI